MYPQFNLLFKSHKVIYWFIFFKISSQYLESYNDWVTINKEILLEDKFILNLTKNEQKKNSWFLANDDDLARDLCDFFNFLPE